MEKVVIIGYGGHGFVAADILLESGYDVAGYCDNEEKKTNPFGLDYLGPEKVFFLKAEHLSPRAFIAIGSSKLRRQVFEFLLSRRVTIINAIHPRSIVSKKVVMGHGIFVAANAAINPACHIGNGVICNTSSSIDHECIIGDFSHICPGAVLCGNVTVGSHSFIGANSVVKPGVTIGDEVVIGAGSTVIKDIVIPGVYFGSPARQFLKK